jgi:two-component system cell cycle sensor histidine kinase/response regulator CckA
VPEPIHPTTKPWAWDLLSRAGRLLGASLDVNETLRDLGHLLVPAAADAAVVRLLDERGDYEKHYIVVPPEMQAKLDGYLKLHSLAPLAGSPAHHAVTSGQTVLIQPVQESLLRAVAQDEAHFRLLASMDVGAILAVPLVARGRAVGEMSLVLVGGSRRFDQTTCAMAEAIAARAALAIDTARLVAAELRSATLLDTLLTRAPMGFAFVDREQRIVRVNAAFADFVGLPASMLVGCALEDVAPRGREDALCVAALSVERTGDVVRDLELSAPDPQEPGDVRYWTASCYPVNGARGQADGVGIVVAEITERRRAEARLRDREALLHLVTSHSRVGLTVINADRVFTFVNTGYSDVLGLEVHDVLYRRVEDVLGPLYDQWVREPLERAFAGASSLTEVRLPAPEGERAFLVSYQPRHEAERVTDVVMVVADVSERHRAVAAQLESEERLRLAAESAGFAVWELDLGRMTVDVTPRWWTLHGRSPEDRTPTVEEWWAWVHPDDVRAIRRAVRVVRDTGENDVEYRTVWPDGSVHWLAARSRAVPGSAGERVLGVLFDITARRQLSERILELQRAEAVGRLAGGVAHEVNNQMTVVLGALEFLSRRPDLPPAARSDLEHIRRAAERSAKVTNSLLAYSRKQVLQPGVLDLNEVVRDQEPVLRRILGGTALEVRLAPEPAVVRADRAAIEQALANLVLNARDATAKGGSVVVELELVPGSVRLKVSDTGQGMSPDTLAHVFEPFFTTKPTGEGSGLGLSVVQGIVEQHHGVVRASSDPGRGTTFVVDLPESAEPLAQPAAPKPAARGHGETVLVVEDEPLLRRLACRALKSAGYEVLAAGDGEEAMVLLRNHPGPVDLVVTDVVMPGVDGPALGRAAATLRPGVPVLYMSGHTDQDLVGRKLIESDAGFLQKPFTPETLVRAVARALESRRGPEAGAWA